MLFEDKNLKIALPNKGRLKEPAIELFKKAGYSFRVKSRALYASCSNSDITFVFLRADDIPVLVDSGAIHLGVTGQDLVIERKAKVEEVMPLGFGKCRLCVAGHESIEEGNLTSFKNKMIATSFPSIAENFFAQKGISVDCKELNGSVEIMIALKMAAGIVDIVETGDSLRANNLKVIETIGHYETVLIGHPDVAEDKRVQQIKRRIEGLLIAQRYSLLEYNIPKENLPEAEKITPGFKSPTISTLEDPGWMAVKVMVEKKSVISVMEQLEHLGAAAILETEIRNCRL